MSTSGFRRVRRQSGPGLVPGRSPSATVVTARFTRHPLRVRSDGMTHPPLVETHRAGPHTRERIVRASECPALAVHGIAHVGLADAAPPYAMVRTDLAGTYFLACFSGEGRILLDGRW